MINILSPGPHLPDPPETLSAHVEAARQHLESARAAWERMAPQSASSDDPRTTMVVQKLLAYERLGRAISLHRSAVLKPPKTHRQPCSDCREIQEALRLFKDLESDSQEAAVACPERSSLEDRMVELSSLNRSEDAGVGDLTGESSEDVATWQEARSQELGALVVSSEPHRDFLEQSRETSPLGHPEEGKSKGPIASDVEKAAFQWVMDQAVRQEDDALDFISLDLNTPHPIETLPEMLAEVLGETMKRLRDPQEISLGGRLDMSNQVARYVFQGLSLREASKIVFRGFNGEEQGFLKIFSTDSWDQSVHQSFLSISDDHKRLECYRSLLYVTQVLHQQDFQEFLRLCEQRSRHLLERGTEPLAPELQSLEAVDLSQEGGATQVSLGSEPLVPSPRHLEHSQGDAQVLASSWTEPNASYNDDQPLLPQDELPNAAVAAPVPVPASRPASAPSAGVSGQANRAPENLAGRHGPRDRVSPFQYTGKLHLGVCLGFGVLSGIGCTFLINRLSPMPLVLWRLIGMGFALGLAGCIVGHIIISMVRGRDPLPIPVYSR